MLPSPQGVLGPTTGRAGLSPRGPEKPQEKEFLMEVPALSRAGEGVILAEPATGQE